MQSEDSKHDSHHVQDLGKSPNSPRDSLKSRSDLTQNILATKHHRDVKSPGISFPKISKAVTKSQWGFVMKSSELPRRPQTGMQQPDRELNILQIDDQSIYNFLPLISLGSNESLVNIDVGKTKNNFSIDKEFVLANRRLDSEIYLQNERISIAKELKFY